MNDSEIDEYDRVFGSETSEDQNDDPEFERIFLRNAKKIELRMKREERERRPAESQVDLTAKETALKEIDRELKAIEEEESREERRKPIPIPEDEDIIGAKNIKKECGYDPEKEVWTAIKRAAAKLGITIRHVNGPRSQPVLKKSECNHILALKIQMEKKRRKKSATK